MATQINGRDDTDVIAAAELFAAPAVEVNQLTKTYPGGVEAVKGIDFRVAPGEVFGLLGPNGAGKSTTIGMLTTTITPTGGTARLAGFDVAQAATRGRGISSVVFQEAVVDRGLSGRAQPRPARPPVGRRSTAQAGQRIAELGRGARPRPSSSTGRSRATAAASGAGWRSRARWSPSRRCCSSTSRPSASTRGSGTSCWTSIAGLRGTNEMTIVLTTHYLDEAAASVRPRRDRPLRRDRRARHARGAARRPRRRDHRAARRGRPRRSRWRRCAPTGSLPTDAFAVGSTLTVPAPRRAPPATRSPRSARRACRHQRDHHPQPTLDDVYLRLTGDGIAACSLKRTSEGEHTMATTIAQPAAYRSARRRAAPRLSGARMWTLARRRAALTAHNPRQIARAAAYADRCSRS